MCIRDSIYTQLARRVDLKMCHWKFSHKKLCSRLYSTELEFYSQKTTNSLSELSFRGNVRTSSIARWKARGRLPIRDNWTFFASSYGWDVISRYWSKSVFFKGRRVTIITNFRWKGTMPTNLFWRQKIKFISLSCGVKISAYVLSFRHKARVWRTDGRRYWQTDKMTIPKTALA